MNRTTLLYLILSGLLLTGKLYAEIQYETVLELPWGSSENQIELRPAPDGKYGPASFAVTGDTISILDANQRLVKRFAGSQWLANWPVPLLHESDFEWAGADRYYQSDGNSIIQINRGQIDRRVILTDKISPIAAIELDNEGNLMVADSDNQWQTVSPTGRITNVNPRTTANPRPIIRLISPRRFEVEYGADRFFIESSDADFGSAIFLGKTNRQNLYFYLEKITQHVPLRVKREVAIISPAGRRLTGIDIPNHNFARVFREFRIADGHLYHLMTTATGIRLLKWTVDETGPSINNIYRYPDYFYRFEHYNLHLPAESQVPSSPGKILDFPTVSRGEALAIGDTYVQHTWSATSDNLTNGLIQDPNGVDIRTPSWVGLGTNNKVPYKWGGFNTLTGFDDGLAGGRYAGDNATTGVSSYCVGVDCSGFVSRCWKLPTHYSTRMMDDEIAVAYASWTQIQPGDAVHVPGHVRLAVTNNPNNSILTVEASGADWRVSYRTYYYYQLSNYTPRYYIHMQDLSQPELQMITLGDSSRLHWEIASSSGMAGIKLENWQVHNWTDYLDGELLAADNTNIELTPVIGTSEYYRLRAVAEDATISPPTDGYGYADFGTEARLLLVDGFDRFSGSYSQQHHDFLVRLGQSLESSEISFTSAANETVIDGRVALTDYSAVFWLLGDESTADETFDSNEQALVSAYLRAGGRLFVSGAEIAWDLDHKGSTSDRNFIRDYLKVLLNNDDSGSYTVTGVSNTDFAGLTLQFDNGSHGIYPEDYPDSYQPQFASETLLAYSNNQVAAVGYRGQFGNSDQDGGVVTMGFPIETIYDDSQMEKLVMAVLDYLDISADSAPPQPLNFTILPNYPNPFNGQTHLVFSLSEPARMKVNVYNLLGQQVMNAMQFQLKDGKNIIPVNFSNLPSGIYFYAASSGSKRQTAKFVVVK